MRHRRTLALWIAVACGSCWRPVNKLSLDCPAGAHLIAVKTAVRQERYCARDDGIRDGPAVVLYNDGTVRETGSYRNNKRHGVWQFWRDNGTPWQRGEWRDGAVVRLEPILPPCGPGTVRNGAPPPVGRAVWCQRRGPEGAWVNHGAYMAWHDDGEPQAEGTNADGEPDGEFSMWYPDGSLKARGAYVHGKEQGLWLSWHDNGQLFIRALFDGGKESGPWVSWWEEGVKSAEGEFRNGEEQGAWTFWHPNGKKSLVGVYSSGKRDGWWQSWDAQGREQPMELFRMGLRVGLGASEGTAPAAAQETTHQR